MTRTLLLSLAGAATAVLLAYGSAQAAPASASLDGLKTLNQSTVQQVRCHRRCHRTRWGWRCHRRCW